MASKPLSIAARLTLALVLGAASHALTAAGAAGDAWPLCDHHPGAPEEDTTAAVSDVPAPVRLFADRTESQGGTLFQLWGDILVDRGGETLRAQRATYDKGLARASAAGGISYKTPELSINGSRAEIDLGTHHGVVYDTHYELFSYHANGAATKIVMDGEDRLTLEDATFTTCDPGQIDWQLRSSEVKLDNSTGTGSARDVTLKFKGLPFLYLPYLTFPLDDRRRTGILVPDYGSSTNSGTEFSLPFYWNIAPNRDATITPRLLSKRGIQLQTEFRYLNPNSVGALEIEHIADDKLTLDDRFSVSMRHNATLTGHWKLGIDYHRVSDADYFTDFGSNLATSSTTHLEQRLDLNKTSRFGAFTARVQRFQTVDETILANDRPYEMLPQLRLETGTLQAGALNLSAYAEYTQFEREDSLTGKRTIIKPTISMPVRGLSGFFVPSVSAHQAEYDLTPLIPLADTEPSVTVPIASVDTGIFLERPMVIGQSKLLHTLEPRLFYLHVPFRDQNALPVFDSGVIDFSLPQIFRENRFSGGDRVGDTEQVSFALTTRVLEADTGKQRFSASVGQIRYLDDRQVTLPGGAAQTERYSDVITEVSYAISSRITTQAYLQWNRSTQTLVRRSAQLNYSAPGRRLLNLAYRFREAELEQSDVSVAWPLARRWHAFGRWYYSHLEERKLESLAGVEYDSCCWRLQVLKRDFVSNAGGDINSTLLVQLALKGLARLGQNSDEALARAIAGY